MVECVNAFKLELPQDLMDKVDVIHEEFRNPSMYYCEKKVCMEAPFLKDPWHAAKPSPTLASQVLKAPATKAAAVAAAAAAITVYLAMKR